MDKKKRIWLLLALIIVLIIIFLVSRACTTEPVALHMEVDTVWATIHSNTFNASGPAVEKGYVCEIGIVDEVSDIGQPPPESTPAFTIVVDKHFVCGDDSGSFDMKMTVIVDRIARVSTGTWQIVNGTGKYTKLRGNGTILGQNGNEIHINDVYDGKVH